MPFDAFGWSPTNAAGFGGRQVGDYFSGSYFNPDTGRLQGSPYVSQQVQSTAPAARPYVQGQPFAPPAQMDFFAQLAGLVGGGAPQGMQAPPQQQGQQFGTSGGNLWTGQFQGGPSRPVVTPGGQGRYGGVSPAGQQQMMRGYGQAYSNQQGGMYGKQGGGFGNPLSNLPYGGGNGLFRRGGGGAR